MDFQLVSNNALFPGIPERLLWENIEIFVLILAVAIALVFNSLVLAQTLSTNNTLTHRNHILGKTRNCFSMFKINLCISDFLILLIYALGKIIWLITFEWSFGNLGCKFYKFLSSFSFYASSNIIVAIAIDRLICVYSTQIQGANSMKRIRLMLIICWMMSFICSIPQLYMWQTIQLEKSNWSQCVSVFVADSLLYRNTSNMLLTSKTKAAAYEIAHQSTVFWIPLIIIIFCYFFIVLKLVSFSIRARDSLIRKRFENDDKSCVSLNECYTSKLSDTFAPLWKINSGRRNSHQISGRDQIGCSIPATNSTTTTVSSAQRVSGSWRKQLRSRVFKSACLIVVAHIVLWLPYNFISATRFFNENFYNTAMENGGNVLEDLIIINSLLNPLIYAERSTTRGSRRRRA